MILRKRLRGYRQGRRGWTRPRPILQLIDNQHNFYWSVETTTFFWPRFHATFYSSLIINTAKKQSVAASRQTATYYKILQYLCAANPLAGRQEADIRHSRYGKDKQTA